MTELDFFSFVSIGFFKTFGTIWDFYIGHTLIFLSLITILVFEIVATFFSFVAIWVLSQFEILRFVTIWGLRFVTIRVFKFCHNARYYFEFLSQFKYFSFVINLSFWILSQFGISHKLSCWVLLQFEFLSFVKIWIVWICNNLGSWVLSLFEFLTVWVLWFCYNLSLLKYFFFITIFLVKIYFWWIKYNS